MKIVTASGKVTINKRSAYGKWLQGWISCDGFTGASTLSDAWDRATVIKTNGCSWECLGKLMASEQKFGKGCAEPE